MALCLLLLPLTLPAQELTYQQVFQDARDCFEALDYDCAIAKFNFLHLDIAKTEAEKSESREWLDRAKDEQVNALRRQLAISDSLRVVADSALNVANQVLDQMYFYEGKFGLTIKNITNQIYRYGFIDRNGEEVIPFKFQEATPFSTRDGFARVKMKGKKYLLDTLGVTYLLAESLEELTLETEALELRDPLPENVGDYQQLKVILNDGRLQNQENVPMLPTSIWQLKQLQFLKIRGNQLSSLPAEFGNLQQLQSLDLGWNQLHSLPPEIGKLKQLQSLYIRHNQLSSLPPEIGNLKQLHTLDLSYNHLNSLPAEFGNLEHLQSLDLSKNRLRSLPPNFRQLQQLESLDLGSNSLGSLPLELLALQQLKNLDLYRNQLRNLPSEFRKLEQLKILNLSKNSFGSLPSELLALPQLQGLDLGYNPISSLPSGLGNLRQLQVLDLSKTQLSSLPAEFGNLQQLQRLDLNSTEISKLPPEFGNLIQLQSLNLRDNQLRSLPLEFGQLQQLYTLNLRDNQLRSLPPEFGQLHQLHTLYLQDNQLSSLPQEFGQLQQLYTLNLRDNQLRSLPPEFGQLQQLKNLYLIKNDLAETLLDSLRLQLPHCEILPLSLAETMAKERKNSLTRRNQNQTFVEASEAQLLSGESIDSIQVAHYYNEIAWQSLLLGEFAKAESAIRRGIELDSTSLVLYTNLPPSLLFQGKVKEATQWYAEWKDKPYIPVRSPTYGGIFLKDLAKFEEVGIIPEELQAEVEAIKELLTNAEVEQVESAKNDP